MQLLPVEMDGSGRKLSCFRIQQERAQGLIEVVRLSWLHRLIRFFPTGKPVNEASVELITSPVISPL